MRRFLAWMLTTISSLIGALHAWLCWYATFSQDGIEKNYASALFFYVGLPLMLVQAVFVVFLVIGHRKAKEANGNLRAFLRYAGAIASLASLFVYFK